MLTTPLIVSSTPATRPPGTPSTSAATIATANNTSTSTLDPRATAYQTYPPSLLHLPLPERLSFLSTPLIPIHIPPTFTLTIPSALLRAACKPSHARSFLRFGAIYLPADTDPHGLAILLHCLWALTTSLPTPSPLENTDLYTALAVAQASYRLGTGALTRHVFKSVEGYLAAQVPSEEEMDAVVWFRGSHPRLWRVMVETLGERVRREGWGEGEWLWRFCQRRAVLYEAVLERIWEGEREEGERGAQGAQEERAGDAGSERGVVGGWPRLAYTAVEELSFEREEYEREVGGGAELASPRPTYTSHEQLVFEQQKYKQREQEARQKRGAAGKKQSKREAEVRRASLAKARASGKEGVMSPEERKWYVGHYGRLPPRGC